MTSIIKIKSQFVLSELFSFLPQERQTSIIQNNKFLNLKFETLKLIKSNFFKERIKNYEFNYIEEYLNKFKEDYNELIKEEELYNMFYNSLSKTKNYYLLLSDKDFFSLIKNNYFNEHLSIEIDNLLNEIIPKIPLIKDNKLTEEILNILKNIFDSFSFNEKLSKYKASKLMSKIMNKEIKENDKIISDLFEYWSDKNEYLNFKYFCEYYYDRTEYNIDEVWKSLYNLGYNNLLKQNESCIGIQGITLNNNNYNVQNENEFSLIKFLQIPNQNLFRLSFGLYVDKIFSKYLNEKEVFKKVKVIEISISNLNKMVKLKIICPNVEELNFHIIDKTFKYKMEEINNIFPNIKYLNLFIHKNFDLIDLFDEIKNSKIEKLGIFIF